MAGQHAVDVSASDPSQGSGLVDGGGGQALAQKTVAAQAAQAAEARTARASRASSWTILSSSHRIDDATPPCMDAVAPASNCCAMPKTTLRPVQTHQADAWARAYGSARARFAQAVDLVLIHNERDVRGNQPRTVLNPLIVLFAVSAWERLIAELYFLGGGGVGKNKDRTPPGLSRPSQAFEVLTVVTAGTLPSGFQVTIFDSYRGVRPEGKRTQHGDPDGKLSNAITGWIDTRNAVAHAAMGQLADSEHAWRSDAAGGGPLEFDAGLTVQAGGARACLSLFIQLVDQIAPAVEQATCVHETTQTRLPSWWFDRTGPSGVRGVNEPGALWGGHELTRRS